MAIDLKISLGTINYTDYLHVTASKVSTPSSIAWEDWINVPVTNYNFIIPGLDPDNYFIRYYDAATIGALGTLVAELYVNALSGEWEYERRFYTVGGASFGDPLDGDLAIVDPYLIDKNVTGVFKEAFRYYNPTGEYNFDKVNGRIDVLTGVAFAQGEKIAVEIKYKVANTSSGGSGGIYNGNIDVPELTRTLLTAEVNKRLRLVGTAPTQEITLPLLTTLGIGNGFYFDNSVGGTAVQPKILLSGANKIRFNGFDWVGGNLFDEFWVSRGEHLLLKKFDDDYWEVELDYKGTNVGEKVTLGHRRHANVLIEDFNIYSGDEYPRLWWWLTNVLPATHYYTSPNINNFSVSFNAAKTGQFVIDIPSKQFRMPKTEGMMEKGLSSFTVFGLDTVNRPVDYSGGYQEQMNLAHTHRIKTRGVGNGSDPFAALVRSNVSDGYAQSINGNIIETEGGPENRVKNIGVIYGRRI